MSKKQTARSDAASFFEKNKGFNISEMIAVLSSSVALFMGIIAYLSYSYMYNFFSYSGLNSDLIPVSFSDSLDVFKKYILFSYFIIGLLCIFVVHSLFIAFGQKRTGVDMKLPFSSNIDYSLVVNAIIFICLLVFYLLFSLTALHAKWNGLFLNLAMLVELYIVYIILGARKLEIQCFLAFLIVAIFVLFIIFYQVDLNNMAEKNVSFLSSEKNLSKVVLKQDKSERKIFFTMSSGVFYFAGNNVEFTAAENVEKYIYPAKFLSSTVP